MGSYKFLMVFMSSFEMLYGLIDLLVQPEVKTMNSFWLTMTSTQKSVIPLSFAYPLLLVWGGAFGIALASFGIHFVYRYLIVTGNKKWGSGNRILSIWMSIPILLGIVYVFVIHCCWQLSPVMDSFVKTRMVTSENLTANQFIYFSSYPFKTIPHSPVIEFDFLQISGIIFLCVSVSISFFTMTYFGVKTYLSMKTFQETSSSTKNLQTQLFYSLVIQTIIPVVLIHFPTTLIYISTFFDTAYEIYGKVVTITIALFPAIDPLPSLLIIKPYRHAIKNCFKNRMKKMGSVDTSTRGISISRPGTF